MSAASFAAGYWPGGTTAGPIEGAAGIAGAGSAAAGYDGMASAG